MNLVPLTLPAAVAAEIQAYARGWHDALNWREPHLNPYPARSPEWLAYAAGLEDNQRLGFLTLPQAH
jgi:hypothetical protein